LGSGVATTVTLGSVAYPMLAKVGYGKDAAGGLLAAGGLGAIISPPVLARRLPDRRVPQDLVPRRDPDGDIPTCLYYLALFAMSRSTCASSA